MEGEMTEEVVDVDGLFGLRLVFCCSADAPISEVASATSESVFSLECSFTFMVPEALMVELLGGGRVG